jgi:hypothetical protein
LLGLVGDAETRLQIDVLAKLAQQLGAERVDRSALHSLDAVPELSLQTLGNFAGCLVRECEDADSRRVDVEPLDEVADALD